MSAVCPNPQKNKATGFPKKKTTGLPPPKRGKIKVHIIGSFVKAVVSMVKPGDQVKKMETEAGVYNSNSNPNV